MGRMIDIMRKADRRSVAELAPAAKPVETIREQESGNRDQESEGRPPLPTAEHSLLTSDVPALEDDNDVPYIEVGGPREPSLRLVPAAENLEDRGQRTEDRGQGPATLPLSTVVCPPTSTTEPLTLFTIRFQPVHAARLGGRSPVAELIAFHQPDHPISVQYRSLAAEIARQLPGALPRVLLFAGATSNIGTSTVLLNLAMTLARQDAKVTVADAHLARPALAARLGLPDGPGLREVLAGQMPPAWCLQETAHPNLLVLPAGTAGQPREGADLTPILEMLRDRSDCVLLDVGPWGDGTLAPNLAAGSDAIYLVLSHESAGTPATGALQDEILEQTGRLRGCVLTQR
jgi:Mrp family chromosome partitioning ATPase